MNNCKILVTHNGKHPASKWADLAVGEIMEISSDAPDATIREAKQFQDKLQILLTHHHQHMMDHEQDEIKKGRHDHHHPYETEAHAKTVLDEICDLAKGTKIAEYFEHDNVKQHIENVCNHYFKSAKHVERQHFHSTKAVRPAKRKKG